MRSPLFFLVSVLCFTVVFAGISLTSPEADALIALREDLGVDNLWKLPENPCNWTGITCKTVVGQIPKTRVTHIVLSSKNLYGFLSPAIGWFSELRELSLPGNDLFDRIPAELGNCTKLERLNLGNNRFSGEIPPEFSNLVSLRALDLSCNRLSGDLRFLKLFSKLEHLSVSDNFFTGKIPQLGSLRNLRSVNLTDNNLEGEIPKWVFKFEVSDGRKVFSGNPKLCGYPLDRECSPIQTKLTNYFPRRFRLAENSTNSSSKSNHSTTRNETYNISDPPAEAPISQPDHKHKKHVKNWIISFLTGAIAGLLSGLLFSVLFRLVLTCIRGRIKYNSIEIFSPIIKKAEDLAFLETEDLSNLEIIGRGGCGEVYKTELPGSNGRLIAIKKIMHPTAEGPEVSEEDSKLLSKRMRQIRSEINTVGRIRHRNLLPLLAHVPRPDCHYLVYEFMTNGSLQNVLTDFAEGKRELEWQIRHKIALGIAAGLEYLHEHQNPRIIHRDLKPANILLDEDLEARIADFGLAKSVPDANTHVTTSNVAGTVGYIAPEYHQTLKFTEKCDIYSFGVLLAALVSGKLPSDDFFQANTEEGVGIVKWLRNVIVSETPTRAIDSKLLGNGYEEQMLLVLKVACFCTMDDPKERPTSKDVRTMLSQVKM